MILVTGATGLNGRTIVRAFSRQNKPVRALVRSFAKASELGLDKLAGVELCEGDMLRPETLGAVLGGIDRVLMISSARERLVETQCSFIDTAKKAGIRHVIKFSGAESGIGFDPTAFRGTRSHEEVERYLEGSGLAWTHLRPSQFMQMYLFEPPSVAVTQALVRPMEEAELAPVDVEDIAKVAVALSTTEGHEGKRYAMTGPEALTMSAIAAQISQAIGKPVPYRNIDPDEYRRTLSQARVPQDFIEVLDEVYAERRKRPKSRVDLGTHLAFGIRPTTFAEFARRHASVFRGEAKPP